MRDRKFGQGGAFHLGAVLEAPAPSLATRPASPPVAFTVKTELAKHNSPLARGGKQCVEPSHQRQFHIVLLEVELDALTGLQRIEVGLDREHRARRAHEGLLQRGTPAYDAHVRVVLEIAVCGLHRHQTLTDQHNGAGDFIDEAFELVLRAREVCHRQQDRAGTLALRRLGDGCDARIRQADMAA